MILKNGHKAVASIVYTKKYQHKGIKMGKNTEARVEIYDILSDSMKEIQHTFIESLLESHGYAENSSNPKDALRKSRENIMAPIINNGYLKKDQGKYTKTDKLTEIKDVLKEALKTDEDIKDIVARMNQMSEEKRDDRRMLGFTSPYAQISSALIDRKTAAVYAFLEVFAEIDFEMVQEWDIAS